MYGTSPARCGIRREIMQFRRDAAVPRAAKPDAIAATASRGRCRVRQQRRVFERRVDAAPSGFTQLA
jgi:hypothetical protein